MTTIKAQQNHPSHIAAVSMAVVSLVMLALIFVAVVMPVLPSLASKTGGVVATQALNTSVDNLSTRK